jgi:hypothetical protein
MYGTPRILQLGIQWTRFTPQPLYPAWIACGSLCTGGEKLVTRWSGRCWKAKTLYPYRISSRSQQPRGQRRGSAVARLLGWFESRRGHGCLSLVSGVCCQLEVSATGRSLIQRGSTESGVSECDREASIMRRPSHPRGCCAMRTDRISNLILRFPDP